MGNSATVRELHTLPGNGGGELIKKKYRKRGKSKKKGQERV